MYRLDQTGLAELVTFWQKFGGKLDGKSPRSNAEAFDTCVTSCPGIFDSLGIVKAGEGLLMRIIGQYCLIAISKPGVH